MIDPLGNSPAAIPLLGCGLLAALVLAFSRTPARVLVVVLPLILCFPPFPFGAWVGVFAYAPLFHAIASEPSRWKVVQMGGWIGAAQTLILCHWTCYSLEQPWLCLALLTLIICLMWIGVCVLLSCTLGLRWEWVRLLLTVLVIPAVEYFRAANSWLPLAYLRTPHLLGGNRFLAAWICPLGEFFLSLCLCAISYTLARWWSLRDPTLEKCRGLTMRLGESLPSLLLILVAAHGIGWRQLQQLEQSPKEKIKAALVQTAAACPKEEAGCLLQVIHALVRDQKLDLLCLPETVLHQPQAGDSPRLQPWELNHALRHWARGEGCSLPAVLAGVTIDCSAMGTPIGYRNSAVWYDPEGEAGFAGDKCIAAPIGEAPPFRGVPVLEQWFRSLAESQIDLVAKHPEPDVRFQKPPIHCRIGICYEQMIPDLWNRKGAAADVPLQLQVFLAKLHRFGHSPIERAQSRVVRQLFALEYQAPVLYVADGGSEWISATGKLEAALNRQEPSAVWTIGLLPPTVQSGWQRSSLFWRTLVLVVLGVLNFLTTKPDSREVLKSEPQKNRLTK